MSLCGWYGGEVCTVVEGRLPLLNRRFPRSRISKLHGNNKMRVVKDLGFDLREEHII